MLRSAEKFSVIMRCKIVLVSVLLQVSFSFDISDDDSHQGLAQLARIERPGYWTFVEDKSQSNGVMPYSRFGRRVLKLPQYIIPYPRTGRMLLDSDILDYDESLLPDYSWHNLADGSLADFFFDGKSLGSKRASIAFPPRIGRKKRSISDEDQMEHDDHESGNDKESLSRSQDWSEVTEFDPEFFFRAERRPNSKSRNAFVPRVGKKRSEDEMEEMVENKRALAFQPRIGRASLISRIGRNDPRGIFQVKSRSAFIPRVGRRASFIPRVGRRASFIPRVGRRASFIPRVGRDVSHITENKE